MSVVLIPLFCKLLNYTRYKCTSVSYLSAFLHYAASCLPFLVWFLWSAIPLPHIPCHYSVDHLVSCHYHTCLFLFVIIPLHSQPTQLALVRCNTYHQSHPHHQNGTLPGWVLHGSPPYPPYQTDLQHKNSGSDSPLGQCDNKILLLSNPRQHNNTKLSSNQLVKYSTSATQVSALSFSSQYLKHECHTFHIEGMSHTAASLKLLGTWHCH